jgi:hypothetical protein
MTRIVTFGARTACPPRRRAACRVAWSRPPGRKALLLLLASLPTLTPSPPALTLFAMTPRSYS